MSAGPNRFALFVREDVRDAFRERQLHLVGGFFVLVALGMAYMAGRSASNVPQDFEIELASRLFGPFVFLLPLVALGFVAPALVEKRTTGALTVVLGLPFTRRTVYLGTLVGRSIVIGGAALAAVLAALPVGLAMGLAVDPVRFAGAALALCVLTVTFASIAVAISAVTRSSTRATLAAFGAYVVFVLGLWDQLPMAALYVRHGFAFPDAIPAWVELVRALNPMAAFTNGVAGLFPELTNSAPADPAVYERPAFAFGVLVAWIVALSAFGERRFRTADL